MDHDVTGLISVQSSCIKSKGGAFGTRMIDSTLHYGRSENTAMDPSGTWATCHRRAKSLRGTKSALKPLSIGLDSCKRGQREELVTIPVPSQLKALLEQLKNTVLAQHHLYTLQDSRIDVVE